MTESKIFNVFFREKPAMMLVVPPIVRRVWKVRENVVLCRGAHVAYAKTLITEISANFNANVMPVGPIFVIGTAEMLVVCACANQDGWGKSVIRHFLRISCSEWKKT